MRALRTLSRRGPRREARRAQALRRHRAAPLSAPRRLPALALAVALALTGAAAALAKPKPPKPKVELLTARQEAALEKRAIKLEVKGKQGAKARVKGTLLVDGYPAPYEERLGGDGARLRGGDARVTLRLGRRAAEVLAFGAQACWKAEVRVKTEAAGRSARSTETLRKPASC